MNTALYPVCDFFLCFFFVDQGHSSGQTKSSRVVCGALVGRPSTHVHPYGSWVDCWTLPVPFHSIPQRASFHGPHSNNRSASHAPKVFSISFFFFVWHEVSLFFVCYFLVINEFHMDVGRDKFSKSSILIVSKSPDPRKTATMNEYSRQHVFYRTGAALFRFSQRWVCN